MKSTFLGHSNLLHDTFFYIRASCKGKTARNKPSASKTVEGIWVNQTVIPGR